MGFKASISRQKTNANEVAQAGGAANLVKYAEQGKPDALTPMNPGTNKLLRPTLPSGPTLMTDQQVGALRVLNERVAHESKNAVEGYKLLRSISDGMTTAKVEHDHTIAHQAKNDCKQLQSQHQVAATFEMLRPEYMKMNHQVTALRDQNNAAIEALRGYDNYVAGLMQAV